MPQIENEILFLPTGGINLDINPKLMPKGDILHLLNGRWGKSSSGNMGSVEKIIGNKQVEIFIGEGNSTVIKSIEDPSRDSIIFFIYNNRGNHCIFRLNVITEGISAILYRESLLNFDLDNDIHANIIENGSEGLLYWSSKNNPPRKLNIERAIKYTYEFYNQGIGFWIIESTFVVT
jgi:hypothetical protein